MELKDNIFGCFVSYPPLMNDATEEQRLDACSKGDLFRTYIWGKSGICGELKKLRNETYGRDLKLVLYQFYVKPSAFEVSSLKEIEPYRKREKSIGIPIVITDENFFCESETGRYGFIKQSALRKLDLLGEIVKRRRLDTRVEQLKSDLHKVLA